MKTKIFSLLLIVVMVFGTLSVPAFASTGVIKLEAESVNTNESKLYTDGTMVRLYQNELTFEVNSDIVGYYSVKVATADTYSSARQITINLNDNVFFDGNTSSGSTRLDTYYMLLNKGVNTISFLAPASNHLFLDYIELEACPTVSASDTLTVNAVDIETDVTFERQSETGVRLYSDGVSFGLGCMDAGVYKLTMRTFDYHENTNRSVSYKVNDGEEITDSQSVGYYPSNHEYDIVLNEGFNKLIINSTSSAVYLVSITLTPVQTVPAEAGKYLRIEAEKLDGINTVTQSAWNAGTVGVYNNGNGVTFDVYCSEAGSYTLTTLAGDPYTETNECTITVNGVAGDAVTESLKYQGLAAYHNIVSLAEGKNTINIKNTRGNKWVDYFELSISGRVYTENDKLCIGEPMLTAKKSIYGYDDGYYIKEVSTLAEARSYSSAEYYNKAYIASPIYSTGTVNCSLVAGAYIGENQGMLKNAAVSALTNLYLDSTVKNRLQEAELDITDAEYVKVFSLKNLSDLTPYRASKLFN